MTLAPPDEMTDPAGTPAVVATVTAVLVLRGPAAALPQTLDALARQTRGPEHLVVVDPGTDHSLVETVRAHTALAEAVPDISYVTVDPSASLTAAVRAALGQLGPGAPVGMDDLPPEAGGSAPEHHVSHVWVLTTDTAAAPRTLARLLDAVRRSPTVGVAGPKLMGWEQPGLLHSVGVQLTRSGRVVAAPQPGEPDQGQYDRRTDVLAVPAVGMLVERDLFDRLRGPETVLGDFGADVDFSWRAQQAGHRVVVVPRATVRTGAAQDGDRPATGPSLTRLRRQARRVALSRCSWWALPMLAAWIVLSSTLAALALLVAKRPRAAWAELSDIGAVLTPGRVLGARWRSRGVRRVRRRDLQGLFVPSRTVLRHTTDLIHDPAVLDPHAPLVAEAAESGPVSEEAQDLNLLGASPLARAAGNPGLLGVLVMTVVALAAGRTLGGSLLDRLDQGVAGGELPGVRATATGVWHAWLDGWHGAGLGHGAEQGPHLVVLSALAWLVSHLPLVGPSASPVGTVVALLVTFAMPLATLTAYLAGRVVTHSRWPRALAALAWSTTAVLTTSVAAGRLGAVVAAILLPLVAAGTALLARRGGSATATAATVLGAALLGAFVPALLVLVVVAGLTVLVLCRGGARLRGLLLAVGPLVLLGPWVGLLLERPALLATGPGLSVWGRAQALPWELALLHPGGPGSYPVLLSVPVVAAGLLGLLRAGRRGRSATVLAVLVVVGLAYAVLAPRLQLGTVPVGESAAGAPITAWAGTGLLVSTLALLAAALLGAQGLAVTRSAGGWAALSRWPVAAGLIAAVLLSAGWTTWHGIGDELGVWRDPRPAVAVDQAEGPLANRMLLLEPEGPELAYSLLGREPGVVVRTLPRTRADGADAAPLAAAVSALFEQGAAPGALHPAKDLSDLAVGFVGLRAEPTDPRIRGLDATAGLSRLGEHQGVTFWRVLAGGGSADKAQAQAPGRVRVVTATGEQPVPVEGAHARLTDTVVVPPGATLQVAESREWLRHARVELDGKVLEPSGDRAAYVLPAGPGRLTIDVLPTDRTWRILQGLALLAVVFVALPFGTRRTRRQP